jgi:hypothetical protein
MLGAIPFLLFKTNSDKDPDYKRANVVASVKNEVSAAESENPVKKLPERQIRLIHISPGIKQGTKQDTWSDKRCAEHTVIRPDPHLTW